jgi:hypothetical protein
MTFTKTLRFAAGSGMIALTMLTGCKNKEQEALDQAKSQAVTTNAPQQVQYIDKNGDTVTDTVQPPATTGQKPLVTTNIAPPPAGTRPAETDPVITPAGSAVAMTNSAGQPMAAAPAAAQPAAPLSLTVPAGTELAIRINQHISVKTSRAGDPFSGEARMSAALWMRPISAATSRAAPSWSCA